MPGRCMGKFHASIHFPLAREDVEAYVYSASSAALQSTSLLRGKTCTLVCHFTMTICFNPLPSCEGRHYLSAVCGLKGELQSTSLLRGKTRDHHTYFLREGASIHFPLAREDIYRLIYRVKEMLLQSTSLLRGKTRITSG